MVRSRLMPKRNAKASTTSQRSRPAYNSSIAISLPQECPSNTLFDAVRRRSAEIFPLHLIACMFRPFRRVAIVDKRGKKHLFSPGPIKLEDIAVDISSAIQNTFALGIHQHEA